MTVGLTTDQDTSIREDLKKSKFSKETYWNTKRAKKNRKKRKGGK